MSCQIEGIANLVNPSDIRQCLLGAESNKKFDNVGENELPLQHCLVSLSPVGDILALAWGRRLIVLASKWDSQEASQVKTKFHVVWDGEVAPKTNEWITSVICLPLISHGKSSAGVDWTCIAVGLNSGFVKFYTETGGFLTQEQFHNESITSIKCQSHNSARHSGDAGTSEEIYVLYNTVVCILQGFPLFSTLRAYRNHLARVKANCDDAPPASNLVCKKWGFKSQDLANDAEVIGSSSVNTFDHLMTASISGGYSASYRSSAPQHSLVLATGKRPFVGFHFALEGAAAPVLSDVAIAMASKVASAIGSAVPWFRAGSRSGSVSAAEKAKSLALEPAESMACRFGLSDVLREGDCLTVSPNKLLSVVCDALGRVVLLDNKQGVAVRMWKGYRDAQCGWIEAVEERVRGPAAAAAAAKPPKRAPKRTALFLVIYAPKMGIIDIWSIQFGIKITTFSAHKNGRLLYTNYGLCGLNDVAAGAAAAGNRAQHPCVFIDPLGGVREIVVPFHFALSSQNRNRATDMHLFKKLKTFLREEEFDEPTLTSVLTKTCMDLRTNDVRLQALEMLMASKHVTPDSLLAATNCFKQPDTAQDESEAEPSASSKALARTTSQLRRAIEFYKYARAQSERPPEYCGVAAPRADLLPDGKQLASVLSTSEREVERVLRLARTLADLSEARAQGARVSFKEDGRSFLDFLGCFEFGSPGRLGLHKDTSHDKKCQIAKLVCQGWMYSGEPASKWQECALSSDIQPAVLMELALLFWLTREKWLAPLEVELLRLSKLLNAICSLNCDSQELYAGYNGLSQWWREVRGLLSGSDNPFGALTAAMACRAVSVGIQRSRDRSGGGGGGGGGADDNGNEEAPRRAIAAEGSRQPDEGRDDSSSPEDESVSYIGDWENVSRDACQFSLLIGNLEDITMLNAVVGRPPPPRDETCAFYALPYESTSISLGLVVCRGKGSVSEIVAKWLGSAGVDPTRLVDTSDVEFYRLQMPGADSAAAAVAADEATSLAREDSKALLAQSAVPVGGSEAKADGQTALASVLDKLSLLKRHFPYSLTSSVLLANLAWEYAMAWNRDIAKLAALEAALAVLRAIPSRRARHGVCCLLWSVHLKKRMESIGKLVNKLGKLPRERLCMQDVGLTDAQVVTFLQHCAAFLDAFLDAEVLEEDDKCSFVRAEELWEGHPPGPQPFIALAVSQAAAWYDLLLLHLQLAHVLHMMAHFNLKFSKPISNLFDSMAHQYFFQDISDKAIVPWYKDDKRDQQRVDFLCRVITASMESIRQETTSEAAAAAASLDSKQAMAWMSKCQNLASTWKINSDELRIHQVCELYVNGFDRLAEEVLIAVNDTERLASKLLPIAGSRMMAHLAKVPDLLEEVSRISPTLTTYLQSLTWDNPSLVHANCTNDDTVELVRKVSRYLPESHSEYHVAQLMLDATFMYAGETRRDVNA